MQFAVFVTETKIDGESDKQPTGEVDPIPDA
jgi:hypothetical protein